MIKSSLKCWHFVGKTKKAYLRMAVRIRPSGRRLVPPVELALLPCRSPDVPTNQRV